MFCGLKLAPRDNNKMVIGDNSTHLGEVHQTEDETCQTDNNDSVKPSFVDPNRILGSVIFLFHNGSLFQWEEDHKID